MIEGIVWLVLPVGAGAYYLKFIHPFLVRCREAYVHFLAEISKAKVDTKNFQETLEKVQRVSIEHMANPLHISLPASLFLTLRIREFLAFCERENELLIKYTKVIHENITLHANHGLLDKRSIEEKTKSYDSFVRELEMREKGQFKQFYHFAEQRIIEIRSEVLDKIIGHNLKQIKSEVDEVVANSSIDETFAQNLKDGLCEEARKELFDREALDTMFARLREDVAKLNQVDTELVSFNIKCSDFYNWYRDNERYIDKRSIDHFIDSANRNFKEILAHLSFSSSIFLDFVTEKIDEQENILLKKIQQYNQEFPVVEMERYRNFFEKGLGVYPLSEEQIKAVISDESVNLINAAAGSGKTSVIAAKVAHLIKNKGVIPSRILLLTFSKKASMEMDERVEKLAGTKVRAVTLHSFGYDIAKNFLDMDIKLAFKDKHSQKKDEDKLFVGFITNLLRKAVEDNKYLEKIISFFRFYRDTETSLFDYKSFDEYKEQRKKVNDYYVSEFIPNRNDSHKLQGRALETMAPGIVVRSKEEKIIADTLYMHGIAFEYEKIYPFDNGYKPDFFIPYEGNEHLEGFVRGEENGIYLEHFSINREGEVPPFYRSSRKGISATEIYRQGMEWKRELHQKFKTKLVETYSYDVKEERLEKKLLEILKDNGFRPRPANQFSLAQKMAEELGKVIAKAINTFKLSGLGLEELEAMIKNEASELLRRRNGILFDLFSYCYQAYIKHLKDNSLFDFSDLLIEGRKAIESNAEGLKAVFDYIIVDEFQDTSNLAMSFIESLWQQNIKSRLYFVGDDWQSIYGFNGSDVTLMTSIPDRFDCLRTEVLSTNYRSTSKIVDLGQYFVKRNPMQTQKNTKAFFTGLAPDIAFITRESLKSFLSEKLGPILEKYQLSRPSFLFLGRTNFDLESWKKEIKEIRLPKEFKIDLMTIHKSKGLEADFVFVLPSKIGFPIDKVDDPFLGLMNAGEDSFLHSEERRVFYVAVTRAKRFLIFIDLEDQKQKRKSGAFWGESKQIIDQHKLYENINYYSKQLTPEQRDEVVRFIVDSEARDLYATFARVDDSTLNWKWIRASVQVDNIEREISISQATNTFLFSDTGESTPKVSQIYELIKIIHNCSYEESVQVLYETIQKSSLEQ